jgi:hypothetical protein
MLEGKRIREPQDTRWNSKLHFLQDIYAIQLLDDLPAAVVRLRAHPVQTKIRAAIDKLTPFETATRMVESDNSDLIDSIAALSVVLTAHGSGLYDEGVWAVACEAFRANYLSPPLVIVAVFTPVLDVSSADFIAVMDRTMQWFDSSACTNWCAEHTFTAADLRREADDYFAERKDRPSQWSRKHWVEHIGAIQLRHRKLALFLEVVASFTASEASCERLFSYLKKTLTAERKSMLPDNAEAVLKVLADSRRFTRESPFEDPEPQPVQNDAAPGQDEAAVAAAARNEEERNAAFVLALDFIVVQAAMRMREDTSTRTSKVAKTICQNCGQSLNCHDCSERVNLQCVRCMGWTIAACAGIVLPSNEEAREKVQKKHLCKKCEPRGQPWFG